jgi:hypothetical protein
MRQRFLVLCCACVFFIAAVVAVVVMVFDGDKSSLANSPVAQLTADDLELRTINLRVMNGSTVLSNRNAIEIVGVRDGVTIPGNFGVALNLDTTLSEVIIIRFGAFSTGTVSTRMQYFRGDIANSRHSYIIEPGAFGGTRLNYINLKTHRGTSPMRTLPIPNEVHNSTLQRSVQEEYVLSSSGLSLVDIIYENAFANTPNLKEVHLGSKVNLNPTGHSNGIFNNHSWADPSNVKRNPRIIFNGTAPDELSGVINGQSGRTRSIQLFPSSSPSSVARTGSEWGFAGNSTDGYLYDDGDGRSYGQVFFGNMQHTMHFDYRNGENGASNWNTRTIGYGRTGWIDFDIFAHRPTRAGYRFLGWSTELNGYAIDNIPIVSGTVNYNGIQIGSDYEFTNQRKLIISYNAARSDALHLLDNRIAPRITFESSASLYFIARWEPITTTVTINGNGATSGANFTWQMNFDQNIGRCCQPTQFMSANATTAAPTHFTRTGYRFNGVWTEKSGGYNVLYN